MTMPNTTGGPDPIYGALAASWKWMLGIGILMVVLGLIGLGLAGALTIVSVIWFGVLALIAGVAQLVDAFKYTGWKAVAGHVLLGLVYVAAGVIMVALPVQAAWWLTLLVAASLLVSGVMRIVMAFQVGSGSGGFTFLILSGIASILLGILIFGLVELPTAETVATAESARAWFQQWGWIIGLFVALELIVQGVTMVMIALAARKVGEGNPPSNEDGATDT